jgi:quercetin dioxygenase-like cupin family protein
MSTTQAISILLRSEESAGEVSVIASTVPAGFGGPALHRHDFDEGFYLLDGELTFQLGAEVSTAGPGELAFAPRGAPHTFANQTDRDARILIICTPAGFERYFARVAAERQGEAVPDWALQPVPAVEVLGPRIGE